MKTKNRSYFLSAVLIGIVMMMTACAVERDNAAWYNPLGDKIYGLWYADYPESGIVGVYKPPYSRVVQVVKFNADGTGTWWKMMFAADDASKPLALFGGRYPENGTFDYSVAADGTIRAMRRGEKGLDGSPMTLVFHYQDGAITFGDGGAAQTMQPAPKDYDNLLLTLENSMHGAEMVDFNINDKDITAQNWRQTEGIYIYDGVGTDVTDEKGRTGYTLVALPWYKGDKLTNLPDGFCDDITPEMGWEWVLNRCGSRSIVNNNFFALYNKYTGILRFFYYMPQGTNTGNDHVWQVSMTDNLATHTTIPYGVPNDRSLSNKAAITQDASGTFMDYVTPWVDYRSKDGLIVPNAGWWAFDVDLSLTRSEALTDDDNIKLQMRSWNTNHTSLYSTVEANIDGEMKGSFEGQTKTPLIASSSKGLFGRVGDLVKLGTKITNTVKDIYSGNAVGAIKGGVDLAKNGASLASGKTKASGGETSGTFDGTFEGTINMMMNGTINTDGVIQGSQPTVGIASPTFYLKDFETKNSHLGEGVWNIKKTPMVYALNGCQEIFYWQKEHDDDEFDKLNLEYDYYPHTKKHFFIDIGNWMFFDPSSVEVELNPNIFPEDEIEWMQVDAIAGCRKEMSWTGTDPFRQAIGLEPLADLRYISRDWFWNGYNYDQSWSHNLGDKNNDYVFNFIGTGEYEGQTIKDASFPVQYDVVKTGNTVKPLAEELHLYGCGFEDYIIEPQATCWYSGISQLARDQGVGVQCFDNRKCQFRFPAIEINVTVQVKLKSVDQPIILSRIYLPDCQLMEIFNVDAAKLYVVLDRIFAKKNLSPKTQGHTQSYDFQAARINKCFKLLTGYSR